jgi:hypothetical protein
MRYTVLLMALALGGCATTQGQESEYQFTSIGQPKTQTQLETDKTICNGRMAAAVANNPGVWGDQSFIASVAAGVNKYQTSIQVGLGCMAERGWKLKNQEGG